jgi:hypothetical protein
LSQLSKSTVLLVLAVVVLVFALLIYLAQDWQKDQSIQEISVTGLNHIPVKEILAIIEPEALGKSKKDLPLLKILEAKIEKHSFVRKAIIENDKAHTLNVEIKERRPVAYYRLIDGNLSYLDSSGVIIPFRHIGEYCDMPVVASRSKNVSLDSIVAADAAKIINVMNAEKYDNFNYKISELVYTDHDRSFYFRSISNKKKILFGRADLINQKLNTLDKYFKSELYRKILHENYLVDIRWENEIVLSHISR